MSEPETPSNSDSQPKVKPGFERLMASLNWDLSDLVERDKNLPPHPMFAKKPTPEE